ncbi:uncharacterized protein V6R79_004924 [Siganus canaliculatus]
MSVLTEAAAEFSMSAFSVTELMRCVISAARSFSDDYSSISADEKMIKEYKSEVWDFSQCGKAVCSRSSRN